MNAITFDTHAFVKELTATGFSEAQAEVVTSLVRRAQEMELADTATKSDLAVVRAEMATKTDVAELEAAVLKGQNDTLKWVIGTIGFQTLVMLGAIVTLAKLPH